jgi:8-hydroxy-5-deazaflavin:NADPH oxidoreductase
VTTIGVIGAGHIGRNFSLAAIAHGYEIVISNQRGPETIAALVEELGPKARAATPAQAGAAADFAIIAIPLTGTESVPAEPLAGKIVLTTCNYFVERDGHFPDIDSGRLTVPGYQQAHVPTSRFVRAFNHIDARTSCATALRRARPTGARSPTPATTRRRSGSSPACTTSSVSTRSTPAGWTRRGDSMSTNRRS